MRPNCIAYYRSLNEKNAVVKHSILIHADNVEEVASNKNIMFLLDETTRLKSCEIYMEIILQEVDVLNTEYLWNVGYLTLDEHDNEERYIFKAGCCEELTDATQECQDAMDYLQISEYSKDFVL